MLHWIKGLLKKGLSHGLRSPLAQARLLTLEIRNELRVWKILSKAIRRKEGSMKIFQVPYDFFRNLHTPKYIKDLGDVIDSAIKSSLKEIGESAVILLRNKIVELATLNIDGVEKLKLLLKYAREIGIKIKDSVLNIVLNAIFLSLKNKRMV